MKKTMNLWTLLIVLFLILGVFFYLNNRLSDKIDSLQGDYYQVNSELSEVQNEQTDLQAELDSTSSDSYIENKARSEYGYMQKDEIRLVIENPEVLYEDGVVPER